MTRRVPIVTTVAIGTAVVLGGLGRAIARSDNTAGRTIARPYRAARHVLFRLVVERNGFETSGEVELARFGLAAPERVRYVPSHLFVLRRALRKGEVGPGDVFVDFGSGKGRIVYQAARRYPFARVVGVELVPGLTEIARQNIELRRQTLRCRNVELVTADAVTWAIPDDMTVAYFYSPFLGGIFSTVVDNILASIDRAPRRVRIVYATPFYEHVVEGTGRFRLVRRSKGVRRDVFHEVAVYESIPSGGKGS